MFSITRNKLKCFLDNNDDNISIHEDIKFAYFIKQKYVSLNINKALEYVKLRRQLNTDR